MFLTLSKRVFLDLSYLKSFNMPTAVTKRVSEVWKNESTDCNYAFYG